MVRVAGFPYAKQRDGLWLAGQQHQRRAFANSNTASVTAKRQTARRRERFETVEAVDRHPAQGICAADDGDVHEIGFN